MTPHHLHATRAAQALDYARDRLAEAVYREMAERYREARTIAAASAIQAWRPVIGPGGIGGHGDPSSRAAVASVEPEVRDGRLRRLQASTTATLAWLADAIRLPPAGDPLPPLGRAIPRLPPAACRELTLWLDEADHRIREVLHLDPDGQLLPGRRCPRCGRRQLTAHAFGPRHTWTVTCTPTCLCIGDDCPCGMASRLAGVRHVWGPDHPLVTTLASAA
ncbi:hypothetical protein [Micromonospora chersina]|uniref:hypothetical protein n=1 Tax=Micromonospora chersina TaxID=47854 RepID=UPI0033F06C60